MNYNLIFQCLANINEIKKKYKELCKKLHPDLGGCELEFKKMREAYEQAINGKASNDQERSDNFTEVLDKIISLINVLNVEIIGTWIWVSGNTKDYKEELKLAGFRYSLSKKMWYYTTKFRRVKGSGNIESIRKKYGSNIISKKLATIN
jgi:hypothetical protein